MSPSQRQQRYRKSDRAVRAAQRKKLAKLIAKCEALKVQILEHAKRR
jgi:hypothetical protein